MKNTLHPIALSLVLVLALAGCGGGGDDTPPHVGPVTVALLGDSTQWGNDGADEPTNGARAPHQPGVELQADMDARFGPGAVVVTNYGKSSTTAAMAPKVVADVIVPNFGINDMRTGVTVADFKAAMLATGATLIETQSPIVDRSWPETEFVAASKSLGLPVADVNAYVLSLPGWQTQEGTVGVHPNDQMYKLIVDNVLAPAVAVQVAAILERER